MDTLEELKQEKRDNAAKINKLEQQIEELKGNDLSYLDKPAVVAEIDKLRARLSELTQANRELAAQIVELEKEKTKQGSDFSRRLNLLQKAQLQTMKRTLENEDVYEHSSKRSSVEQDDWKRELIKLYDCQNPNNRDEIYCMVLRRYLPKFQVKAAHIYPHKAASELYKFGLQEADAFNLRNGLLLADEIEKAFDKKRVCFIYNGTTFEFIFTVLDPALKDPAKPHKICESSTVTFAARNGQALDIRRFPTGQAPPIDHPLSGCQPPASGKGFPVMIPFRRLLGDHARWSFRKALDKGWIQQKEHDEFTDYLNTSQNAVDPEADLRALMDELEKESEP